MTQFIATIVEIIKATGQYDRFSQRGSHFSLKIDNPPFLPLVKLFAISPFFKFNAC